MNQPKKKTIKEIITDVAIIAAIITILFQFYIHKIEKKENIVNSQKEIIFKTCTAYAKIARAKNIMKEVNIDNPLSNEADKEIGEIFVEVLVCSKLAETSFNNEIVENVNSLFGSKEYTEQWWLIPNDRLNIIIKDMILELKENQNNFWLFV